MSGNDDSTSDSDLFRQAIGEVKRLRHDHAPPTRTKPPGIPAQSQRDEREVIHDMLSLDYLDEEVQPGDRLDFSAPGLQRRVITKLRRGGYRREAELDLHGMTADMAKNALARFLADARYSHWRCLKIIHGKGRRSSNRGPILKSRLNTWLRHRSEVLAFCSAPPNDGGTGAVYVLLRSPDKG